MIERPSSPPATCPPQLTRSLVLVGLMGAGKTSVGKRLAQLLGVDFTDSDAEIERAAGGSPKPGRFPEDVEDYAAGAEELYAVGTRLFTVGLNGPDYDLGPVRDLLAWRDARHTGAAS